MRRRAFGALMKIVLDFFSLILFFAAFYISGDIRVATIVAVVAGVAQAVFVYARENKLEPVQIGATALIVVFGSLTILLKDPIYIKWKATLVYLLFAAAFAVTGRLRKDKKNALQLLIGGEIQMDPGVWRRLNAAWMIFFLFLAGMNLFVVYNWPGDDKLWVNYKTFGVMGFFVLFALGQGFYIARNMDRSRLESAIADAGKGKKLDARRLAGKQGPLTAGQRARPQEGLGSGAFPAPGAAKGPAEANNPSQDQGRGRLADPGLGVDGASPAPAQAHAHSKAQSDDSALASPSASSPDAAQARPQATEPKAQPRPKPIGAAETEPPAADGANKEQAAPAAKKAGGLAGKKRGAKTAASARAPRKKRQVGKHGKKRSGAKRRR